MELRGRPRRHHRVVSARTPSGSRTCARANIESTTSSSTAREIRSLPPSNVNGTMGRRDGIRPSLGWMGRCRPKNFESTGGPLFRPERPQQISPGQRPGERRKMSDKPCKGGTNFVPADCFALSGLAFFLTTVPRALPWAGLFWPLRGTGAERRNQLPGRSVRIHAAAGEVGTPRRWGSSTGCKEEARRVRLRARSRGEGAAMRRRRPSRRGAPPQGEAAAATRSPP